MMFSQDLASVYDAFGEAITYQPAGGAVGQAVPALRFDEDVPADAPGGFARRTRFQLRLADVPDPLEGDSLTDAGGLVWHVKAVEIFSDFAEASLMVERDG